MLKQLLFAISVLFLGVTHAQAPNTFAIYNPNLRTASDNGTTFILPIPDATAATLASPYDLLEVPVNDTTLFPNGFPAGMHPLYVHSGLQADIRILDLEIDCLLGVLMYLPFVDRLADGQTAFAQPVGPNYVGGCNGNDIMPYVPAIVGSLGGTPILPGSFLPSAAAYQTLANNEFSVGVKEQIVPNPLSGPSVEPAVVDVLFSTTSAPLYTEQTFYSLLNQPIILDDGLCLSNNYYFNESFADPVFVSGSVSVYMPSSIEGVYTNAGGLTVTAEVVGQNAGLCADVA